MLSYIVKRLFMLIPVLIGMSIIVFSIVHLIPGDPAEALLGERASQQSIDLIREKYGLDKPIVVQYFYYMGNLLKGDLGESIRTQRDINTEIWRYIAATLELSVVAMVIAVFFGVNLGILSAWKQNSWMDYFGMLIAIFGVSMPIFWLGLMEQWIFAVELGWLPSEGRTNARDPVQAITNLYVIDAILAGRFDQLWDVIRHLILPGFALGTIPMAIIARITRSSMVEVMRSDYVRTARAKGLKEFIVIYKHCLKNALIPVVTVIGMQMGFLLGGAVLTETIFGWPGVGRYIYEAIGFRDYPVIQSGILVVAVIFVFINLFVDILYRAIDPRVTYK